MHQQPFVANMTDDQLLRTVQAALPCPVCFARLPLVARSQIAFPGGQKRSKFTFACAKCHIQCDRILTTDSLFQDGGISAT
jgi:hypothetical protein